MASSECRSRPGSIAVLGIGNTLLRDDGVGVHVVEALRNMGVHDERLQLIDAGTSPDVLLSLDSVDKLIVVDAADGGCEPGAVYRFRLEEVDLDEQGVDSLHQMNLVQTLWMMDMLGRKPNDVVIFGIQPKEIELGLEPSDELAQKIPGIAELVLEEIERC